MAHCGGLGRVNQLKTPAITGLIVLPLPRANDCRPPCRSNPKVPLTCCEKASAFKVEAPSSTPHEHGSYQKLHALLKSIPMLRVAAKLNPSLKDVQVGKETLRINR